MSDMEFEPFDLGEENNEICQPCAYTDIYLLVRQLGHNGGHVGVVHEFYPPSPVVILLLKGVT